MGLRHAPKIDGADDIYVVQNEGLAGVSTCEEKIGSLFQAAAGIEQHVLAGDLDFHAEVVVSCQVFEDHPGKMMHIDDHLANAKAAQAGERDLQQRAPGNLHQGLGAVIGERAQARTQARRQDHGFHRFSFSRGAFSDSSFSN